MICHNYEAKTMKNKKQNHLSAVLDHVLVGTDTSSFESFRGKMLTLVGHHVHTGRELIDSCSLLSKIIDSDLRIGDSSAEARLGIRLVLDITVTPGRSATHVFCKKKSM